MSNELKKFRNDISCLKNEEGKNSKNNEDLKQTGNILPIAKMFDWSEIGEYSCTKEIHLQRVTQQTQQ